MDYFRDDTIKNYQIKLINSETIHGYLLLILKLIPFYFNCFLIFAKQISYVGVVVKNYSFLVEKNLKKWYSYTIR